MTERSSSNILPSYFFNQCDHNECASIHLSKHSTPWREHFPIWSHSISPHTNLSPLERHTFSPLLQSHQLSCSLYRKHVSLWHNYDGLNDEKIKSWRQESESWSYSKIGALQKPDAIEWPLTLEEREKLKSKGFLFPGEKKGIIIGSGSFSQVWLSTKIMPDGKTKHLACKKISLSIYKMRNKSFKRATHLLVNELETHKIVNHPNIVKSEYFYCIFDEESDFPHPITAFIFMKLHDGDLSYLFINNLPLKESKTGPWFHQMVRALNYLHTIGIAHRDIKPANILYKKKYDNKYCFKLTDFGLAKQVFKQMPKTTDKHNDRNSETFIGTEYYMAPEIENNQQEYDAFKADVYSLGICLLQSLKIFFRTCIEPFSRNKLQDLPKRVSGKFSEQVKDLLIGMLAQDPSKRFTMQDVLNHVWVQQFPYRRYVEFGKLSPNGSL